MLQLGLYSLRSFVLLVISLLYTQLMFFGPLCSITLGISKRRCREDILSPNQLFLCYQRYLMHVYVYLILCASYTMSFMLYTR